MIKNKKIYIIDDDPLVCKSLVWLIESLKYDVIDKNNTLNFIIEYDENLISCLLLDVRMPGKGGLTFQTELKENNINIPIIFITGHGDVEMAVNAMKNGAHNFLTKPLNNQLLLDSINSALRTDELNKSQSKRHTKFKLKLKSLTAREITIFKLFFRAKSSKEISEQLHISISTVDVHKANILKKLNYNSLIELFYELQPEALELYINI